MITKEEIKKIAFKSGLDSTQIEKDYVLGWLLAGISQHSDLSSALIFKGGTCLRKIYFENYRYSEDLDFTVIEHSTFSLKDSPEYIQEICEWVTKKSGIEFNQRRFSVESLHNDSNQNIFQCKLYYCGPVSPRAPQQWPRIKLDITADEVVVTAPQHHALKHPYSDGDKINHIRVNTYSMDDLFSEKLRALFERTRPRDLYDVVEMFKTIEQTVDFKRMKDFIKKKCQFKDISHLNLEALQLESCAAGWKDQLAHQIHELESFEFYYNCFKKIYNDMQLSNL